MDRVLVVEDDLKVQRALQRLLEPEGFAVTVAADGQAAVELFKRTCPSVVILDLHLPKMRGQQVCAEIRRTGSAVPIIVLSAASDVIDKVLLLEMGADDYMTKPFSPRELLARVRVALRRGATDSNQETDSYSFDDVIVNFSKMEVRRNGHAIPFTNQEFKILKFMISNRERVISRNELLDEVWGYHNYPSTRTVDNHIGKLRQKLERDPGNPEHFKTFHRAGYKFLP